jgi:hypothetical protein
MKFSLLLAALAASVYASALPATVVERAAKCVEECTKAYTICYDVSLDHLKLEVV